MKIPTQEESEEAARVGVQGLGCVRESEIERERERERESERERWRNNLARMEEPTLEEREEGYGHVVRVHFIQGYLAHKKPPPPTSYRGTSLIRNRPL